MTARNIAEAYLIGLHGWMLLISLAVVVADTTKTRLPESVSSSRITPVSVGLYVAAWWVVKFGGAS